MAGVGLVVELGGIGDGDDTGTAVDGEAPARVVRERVGDAIGAVAVAGACRDPDRGAVGGALGDRIGVVIGVADRTDRWPRAGYGLHVIGGFHHGAVS